MDITNFLAHHFFQYGIALEVLFAIEWALFLFGYFKKNRVVNISLIFNGLGIFSIFLFFIPYRGYQFAPFVLCILLFSLLLLTVGIITAAPGKTGFQKYIILFGICILAISLVGVSVYQYLQTKATFTSWKTYISDGGEFSIDYPSSWVYTWDSLHKTYVFFNGEEGSINISYGNGLSQTCSKGQEEMKIGNDQFHVCHDILSNGVERWFLDKEYGTIGIGIKAIAQTPSDRNRETILKMLSTFKFTK